MPIMSEVRPSVFTLPEMKLHGAVFLIFFILWIEPKVSKCFARMVMVDRKGSALD